MRPPSKNTHLLGVITSTKHFLVSTSSHFASSCLELSFLSPRIAFGNFSYYSPLVLICISVCFSRVLLCFWFFCNSLFLLPFHPSGGSSESAEQVVKEIIGLGGQAIPNGSSVTDDKGVKLMIDQAMDEFGRIDILINNAGILIDKSFSKMEIDDFEKVLNVHLIGSVKPTKAVWEIMKEQNYGRILVTSSSSGLYGNFGQTNYGSAKLGLVGFMNTLKLEGQKYNVHCNALPPVAYTRMTANLMPPEAEQL